MAAALRSSLLLIGLVSAGAVAATQRVQARGFLARDAMLPDVVAVSLVKVEDEWRNQYRLFVECNQTATSKAQAHRCLDAEKAFERSCGKIVAAMVQASNGDRDSVHEYMADVCGEPVLEGWRRSRCEILAATVLAGMTPDAYINRESLNTQPLCIGFWQRFSSEEAQVLELERREADARQEKARLEREEAEKRLAEEAAAEARERAEEEERERQNAEKAEAEEKRKEEAEKAEAEAAAAKLEQEEKQQAAAAKLEQEEKQNAAAGANATSSSEAASASAPTDGKAAANASAQKAATSAAADGSKAAADAVAAQKAVANATVKGEAVIAANAEKKEAVNATSAQENVTVPRKAAL